MENYSHNISELERKIEEKIFERINSCIKEERFEVAARICKALGDSERAKELWEKAAEREIERGFLYSAAEYYIEAGYPERTINLLKKYAEEYIKNKLFSSAAETYKDIARIYKDVLNDDKMARKALIEAGDLYMKDGQFEKAAEVYVMAGEIEKAKKVLKKVGRRLRLKAFFTFNPYKRAKIYEKIAEINRFLGKEDKAKKFYRSAAKLYEKKKLILFATRCYERAGDLERAILILEKYANDAIENGFLSSAAIVYEHLSMLYEKQGNKEKAKEARKTAGDLYMKEKWFRAAAEAYEMAGEIERAREAWIKEIEELEREASSTSNPTHYVKILKTISEIYENRLKDPEKAKETWKRLGIFCMEYGLKYKDALMYRNAAIAFENARDSGNAKLSWLLATVEHMNRGDCIRAAEAYRNAIKIKIN